MGTYNSPTLRAFHGGCDARIAGFPSTANPYVGGTAERAAWLRGWEDVHHGWGKEVKGRWRCKPLPPVPEVLDDDD